MRHRIIALLMPALVCACPGPDPGGDRCQQPPDCADTIASTCDVDCPRVAQHICVNGSCELVSEQSVRASADVMLHFRLTGRVHSLVFAWVDSRRSDASTVLICADLLARSRSMLDPSLNVVASGFVNFQDTQGTAFFPDANLGQVPLGELLLITEGRDQARGEGTVVAQGCLDGLVASAGQDLDLTLQLDPV